MKHWIIIILIGVSSCTQNQDIHTIENFINTYFTIENPETRLHNMVYIHYDKDQYESFTEKEKANSSEFFSMYFTAYHLELSKNSNQYQLYSHYAIDKERLKDYKLKYENYDNVYYMVVDNKILTHFILNTDHKIISFCPYISGSPDNKVEPVLLTRLRYRK